MLVRLQPTPECATSVPGTAAGVERPSNGKDVPRFPWHTSPTTLDPTTRAVLEVIHQAGYTTTVVKGAKYVALQISEVAVPRALFAAILDRIHRFGMPPPLVQRG